MSQPAENGGRDRGETLIEILVSVTVLTIVAVSVGMTIAFSVKASDLHRKQSVAGELVRNYAESIDLAIANGGYAACAGTGTYATPPGFSVTSGYSASVVSVTPADGGACPGSDSGVQKLVLRVASSDGITSEQLTIIVRNPCGPNVAACP